MSVVDVDEWVQLAACRRPAHRGVDWFPGPTDKAELNRYLRQVSLTSPLRQQVDYIESPEVVSTDFVGSNRAGIVDGLATIADGTDAVLYVWYDNEYGYSCQVVRVIEAMAGTHPLVLPEREPVVIERELVAAAVE